MWRRFAKHPHDCLLFVHSTMRQRCAWRLWVSSAPHNTLDLTFLCCFGSQLVPTDRLLPQGSRRAGGGDGQGGALNLTQQCVLHRLPVDGGLTRVCACRRPRTTEFGGTPRGFFSIFLSSGPTGRCFCARERWSTSSASCATRVTFTRQTRVAARLCVVFGLGWVSPIGRVTCAAGHVRVVRRCRCRRRWCSWLATPCASSLWSATPCSWKSGPSLRSTPLGRFDSVLQSCSTRLCPTASGASWKEKKAATVVGKRVLMHTLPHVGCLPRAAKMRASNPPSPSSRTRCSMVSSRSPLRMPRYQRLSCLPRCLPGQTAQRLKRPHLVCA